MLQLLWLILLIIPIIIIVIICTTYIFLKRTRGHGYFLSKFSAFTRIRFNQLEQRRQTYCPAHPECRCHTRESAAHIEPNLSCRHRSATLYMSFAGAAMIVGGVRTTEWRGSMKQLHTEKNDEFDALFFTDPAQCFYLQDPNYDWQGLAYYRRLVELYSTLYQRVILIGASLGGSMVCMCADLATLSIAFNPIVDPTLLGLPWRVIGAYCSKVHARIIYNQVQQTMANIKINANNRNCVLHIHWSQFSRADRRQADRIIGGGRHRKPRQNQCITSIIDFSINHTYLSSQSGVYIWLHKSSQHALAMHLKRNRQLIPLLKRHLEGTSLELNATNDRLDDKRQKNVFIIDILHILESVDNQDKESVSIVRL